MAAEQKMHNHVTPPAAASRAVHTHVLDLTSWCVKSGSVQLPQALLGSFAVGSVTAQSDGGELLLELQPPRTLAGLGEFFELHGLRANDRLEFVFEEGGLRLVAHRRDRARQLGAQRQAAQQAAPRQVVERQAAERHAARSEAPQPRSAQAQAQQRDPQQAPQQPPQQQAPQQQAPVAATPRRRASDWTDAVDREMAQAAQRKEQAAAIVVDRFKGAVGELVPGHAQAAKRAEPAASRAEDSRQVTRVRIEGGVPVQTSRAQVGPKDRWSAHNVWARRENAQWHALDTVQAANDHSDHVHDPDFPDTVVRAFRRSPNGTLRDEPLSAPQQPSAPAERAREPRAAERSTPAPAWMTMHAQAPAAPRADRSVANAASPAWNAARDEQAAQPFAPDAAPLLVPDERFEAASDDYFALEAEGEAAPPSARGPRLGVMSRLGLRLGIGRERLGGGGHQADSAPPLFAPRSTGTVRYADDGAAHAGAGGAPLVARAAYSDEPASTRPLQGPPSYTAHHQQAAPARAERVATAAALQDALLDLDEPVEPARQPAHAAPVHTAPAPTATVEDDIAFLEGYLALPGTPAIVRSLDVAERVGMSPERAARALDRLAEHRERVSKIREGAYMVRQRKG